MWACRQFWSCAVVASTQLVLALDTLARLDCELTAVLGYADVLAVSHDVVALAALRRTLEQSQSTMADLRRRVAASALHDDIETRSATLRTQSSLVISQLVTLQEAATELRDQPPELGTRFPTVLDLHRYVLDQLGRVLATWHRERQRIEDISTDRMTRRTLEWLALGNAEWGFTAIGSDPELAHALDAAMGAASERFRVASRTLMLALGIVPRSDRDDREPELPALRRQGRHS